MSSVGASLTGPDTHSALRIEMTVPPTRAFYWRGEQKHEGKKKKKELRAVRGSKW